MHGCPVEKIPHRHLFPIQKANRTTVIYISIIRNLQRHRECIIKLLFRDIFRCHKNRQNFCHGCRQDSLPGALGGYDRIRALIYQNRMRTDDICTVNDRRFLCLIKTVGHKFFFRFRLLCFRLPDVFFHNAFFYFFYLQPVRLLYSFHCLILSGVLLFFRFPAGFYGSTDQNHYHAEHDKKQNPLDHTPSSHASLSLQAHPLSSLVTGLVFPLFVRVCLLKIRFCH